MITKWVIVSSMALVLVALGVIFYVVRRKGKSILPRRPPPE